MSIAQMVFVNINDKLKKSADIKLFLKRRKQFAKMTVLECKIIIVCF